MGDGRADETADGAAESGGPPGPLVAPEWYARPELAPAFTGHDIGALFRVLGRLGVSQRQIAQRTGQPQSAISEIIHGRRVISYGVLVAVSQGLGVPAERMGLSWWGPDGRWYGPDGTYPEGVRAAHTAERADEAMLRRHLIALGGITMVGAPVAKLGELLTELGDLSPVPLPSRLDPGHVRRVQDLTRRLAEAGNSGICDPQVLSDAVARASQWLDVPGPDPVLRALRVAIAELHIEAG